LAHQNNEEKAPLRALFNFGLSGARMAVAGVSGFIVSVIVARSLGAKEMGTYSLMVWVAGTIAALSSLGLPDAVSKYVAEHKGAGDHALAAMIARRIVVAQILAAGVASLIAVGVWSGLDRHHLSLVWLALATVLPSALQQTLLALMEGEQRFDLQVFATMGGSILQIAIFGIIALRHASILGFLLGSLFSGVGLLGLTLFLCRSMLVSDAAAAGRDYSPEISKRIFNFSLSVYGLWLLALIIFDKSELFFLRIFKAPEELAYYSIAFAVTARLATAGDSISYVLFPMFITRFSQSGADGLCEVYQRSIRFLQILMVPICFWGIPLLPRLVVLAYGKQYTRVASVVQILLVTMLFTVTMTVGSSVIYTLDRQASLLRFMILVAVLNIGLDLCLIPRFGALGAALANGISQVCAAFGMIFMVRRLLPGSFPVFASLRIYLAAALSVAPILCAELIPRAGISLVSISVVAAILLYIGLLTLLHAIKRNEFEAFENGFKSLLFRRVG
jgi:O-antigen/teichoic acid export membrane protein